jgi:hypothetical protein
LGHLYTCDTLLFSDIIPQNFPFFRKILIILIECRFSRSIGLLFSGLCRGRLECWVADVSIAMLLTSSELVNKLVEWYLWSGWSIPCCTIYMVNGESGPRGIGGGGGMRGSVSEVSGGCVHSRITKFHVLESSTPWSLLKLFGFFLISIASLY